MRKTFTFVLTFALALAGPALADDYSWTNGTSSGLWADAGNWELNGSAPKTAPGTVNDTAIIPSSKTSPTVATSVTVGGLRLLGGTPNLTLSDALTVGKLDLATDTTLYLDGTYPLTVTDAIGFPSSGTAAIHVLADSRL